MARSIIHRYGIGFILFVSSAIFTIQFSNDFALLFEYMNGSMAAQDFSGTVIAPQKGLPTAAPKAFSMLLPTDPPTDPPKHPPPHTSTDSPTDSLTHPQSLCDFRKNQHVVKKDGPPRQDFHGRIVYMTMGGESYMPHLVTFVQTLTSFGILQENIGIVCIDSVCAHEMVHQFPQIVVHKYINQIDGSPCQKNEQITDTRCRVSLGKAEVVLSHLKSGDAVYFVDADVFFYKHPYESLRVNNGALDFYVQSDRATHYNFGAFLAFPSRLTIQMFQYIKDEYYRTQESDQAIFSYWLGVVKNSAIMSESSMTMHNDICGDPYDFEEMDKASHINMMLMNYDVDSDISLAHATCLEGSVMKLYAAICYFGSPLPVYYLEHKTVSTDIDIHEALFSKDQINILMQGLVVVAQATGRAIRLPIQVKQNLYDPYQPYATVSADFLDKLGVQLVEPQYWERASKKNIRPPPRIKLFNFTVDNINFLKHNKKGWNEVDEIQLSIISKAIEGSYKQIHSGKFNVEDLDNETRSRSIISKAVNEISQHINLGNFNKGELGNEIFSRPLTCKLYPRYSDGKSCLHVCDENHF